MATTAAPLLEKELESIERSRSDFAYLQKLEKFSADEQEMLVMDVADLFGWYRLHPRQEVASLIEQLIAFGERKLFGMEGQRALFTQLKTRTTHII